MKILKILFIGLVFLLFGCNHKTEEKPNVIVFLVDDLGWTDLSSYGSALYQTPNVDNLVSSGIKFTNAYAACTVCSPTRASIMTGKYPARLNCTDWIAGYKMPFAKFQIPDWTQNIEAEDFTLAEALDSLGYSTIHIGKWHLGEEEKHWPEFHGFDENIGGWKKGQPNHVNNHGGYFPPYRNPRLDDGPEDEYLTERLANEAANYIKTHKDEPFFLNFWLYNVHTPLQARQEKIDKYSALVDSTARQSNPTYAAMVEHMDEALGVVINELKASGIYENTIIVFASDNGGLLLTGGDEAAKPVITSNYPLKMGKGNIYEGAVRTPFVVSWPDKIKGHQTSEALTISTDIFPTIMGLIKAELALPEDIDGENLAPLLTQNKAPKRDMLFWHYPHYHVEGASPYSAVRKGEWKLYQVYEKEALELYNLKDDIGEATNLIEQYPEKANELLNILNDWKKEVSAQEPIPNPKYDPEKVSAWSW